MSAEKTFKRWMGSLIVLFILLFAYIVVADRHAPLTSEGRVQSYVVQLSPEITGNVVDVHVHNNQQVKKGDVIISIDRRKFEIALDKAKLSLQSAIDQENTLYSQREAAQARIARAKATYNNAELEHTRIEKLFGQALISKAQLDNALAALQVASANLRAEQESLNVVESQLGEARGQSTPVKIARNSIEQAELDLQYTQILAPNDGIVTNLQVQKGTIARANQPILTFVPTETMWVTADFREKSLANTTQGNGAFVTFDAFPGKIYRFSLASRDFGISAVQQAPDGKLAKVEVNNRWVRDAQRIRVNFDSEDELPSGLFVGSRATVTIYPSNSDFWSMMAKAQIKLVSWYHYIY
ncbi:HlyD family secretion protein [Thalassotalea euphylliae]|uniref:HlyD family secretion protein n=1 Tax=Thalassotalea euphylliae TaxID=1655234 RepID=A0A3E0TIP0_9GAMM|nr:HlyD family secretion protein [Thalassotalea euphylliae]REL24401.1 HlyD family secretion protein [Thalassotalea euphylliae]